MDEISGPHFYDLTPLYFESMLNNPLYLYQKGNINWMLNIEENGHNYINTRRHIKFLDGRIYEYESNKFIEVGDIPYPSPSGLNELRSAAASWMNQSYATNYKSEECIITTGGKFAIYLMVSSGTPRCFATNLA